MIDLSTCSDDIGLAYIAGILDGEGHVGIHMYSGYTEVSRPCFRHIISITNSCKDILTNIAQFFDGRFDILFCPNLAHSRPGSKVVWKLLSEHREQSKHMCELLLPYVFIKAEQVQLLLEYLSIVHSGRSFNDEQFMHQLVVWKKIKSLNARGGTGDG